MGANPESGPDGACDVPTVSHGNPVKSVPRSHSQTTNVAGAAMRRTEDLVPAMASPKPPAIAGKIARYAQKRNVASAASGAGIDPNSCRLTYTQETPTRK